MKPSDLTRRVALFQSEYGTCSVWEVHGDPDKPLLEGYVRVSDVLEITVTPLPPKEITAGQLRTLYAMRANVAAKAGRDIAALDARIESLRALPAPEDVKP